MVMKSRNPDRFVSGDDVQLPSTSGSEDLHFRSEIMRLSREMLDDNLTFEKLKDNILWPFISKTMKLTFIDEKEAFMMRQLLEAEVCKIMRNTSACMQDKEFHEELAQARIIALCNINRAKGTDKAASMLNERIANISQFSQHFSTPIHGSGESRSFLRRLFGGAR